MYTIEQELSELTNNFMDESPAVRCWTANEKDEAVKILKQHYGIVEVSDGKYEGEENMCYFIACSNPKITESLLTEADDFEDTTADDFDMDLSEFDDPEDDLDMEDENLDSIDDFSEVDKANQITVLKKKAADLAEKWKDTFKEISKLATAMDLIASHDDDLNIELKKSDGEDADIEGDLEEIDNELNSEEPEEEFDDDFGPSDYDGQMSEYPDEEPTGTYESLQMPSEVKLVESKMKISSSEIPLREDEVDDDF